jgi:extracellular factor (EF) 3-hydroxypalmitic acid methyl ester biosynthesis protein
MAPIKIAVAAALSKSYEELDGAQGREVFFRPHRYRAQDLSPLKCTVIVRADDLPVECAVYDVSQNGVAFELPPGVALQVGDVVKKLEIRFDSHVAFHGEARVQSMREIEDIRIAGVAFVDFLLDIDSFLQVRDLRRFSEQAQNSVKVESQPWRFEGMERFKALVAEYALYLADCERKMDDLERRLAFNVVHGESQSPGRDSLVEWIRKDFTPEVIRYTETIDSYSRGVPESHLPGLRAFTERHLHDFFMKAPWMHRARFKPFGYPGDFEVMRFFYERDFEGVSLFGKAFHYATIQCKTAQAVVKRKDLVKRQMRQIIESRSGSDKPVRILSVAAGPAQESFELLNEVSALDVPVDLVLFDQDKSALTYAYSRLKPLVERRFPNQVRLLYLHESIKRLLRDRQIFSDFGPFDAIFSSGLYDYLAPTTATVLTKSLFARLAPAGTLLIANMVPESPNRWVMEHLLDWHLIHRSRTELTEIGRRAAPSARIRVLEEETGVNPFIELVRE